MANKKRKVGFICFLLVFVCIFNINSYKTFAYEEIYIGGMSAGFSLNTRGACIVGLCDVITDNGLVSPAKQADIRVGDLILFIDDNEINTALDVENALKKDGDKIITLSRNGELVLETVCPAKDMVGHNKLGVFIRDDISGIGTITFIKGNRFASLGHPIVDENGDILKIIGGNIYECNVTGYVKGEKGKAGELRGVFLRNNSIACIDKNIDCGVFGSINERFDKNKLIKAEIGQAKMGEASIYSTIDGKTPKEYSISIVKIDNDIDTKNFVIKINDKELLSTTGGIVQGMSGSPIVQNGKLVGAVTHVFINDPTRGFGISIEKMLEK